MNFELKDYKLLKLKKHFSKTNFFFFFSGINVKANNWIKIEQELNNLGLNYNKINNNLTLNLLKNSIFKNTIPLVNGPIILILINKIRKLSLKNLTGINPLISLLCLRINNKIYLKTQIQNLINLNYSKNILVFRKSLKLFLKIPFKQLRQFN
jgi:hypothetical protein|nr:hypothetical protein [Attheya longicornis]